MIRRVLLVVLTIGLIAKAYDERAFTCLAPILQKADTERPASLDQAFLNGPWHLPRTFAPAPPEAMPPFGTFTNAAARAAFMEGLTLVHLFDPIEAETAFRYAMHLEPTAPAAYWGLSLANLHRPGRAALFQEEAKRRIVNRADLDPVERELITTWVPNAPKLETLSIAHPEHVAIQALHLHLVLLGDIEGSRPIANRPANDLHIRQLPKGHPARALRYLLWRDASRPKVIEEESLSTRFADRPQTWQLDAEALAKAGQLERAIAAGVQAANRQTYPPDLSWLARQAGGAGRITQAAELCRHMILLPEPLDPVRPSPPAKGIRLLSDLLLTAERPDVLVQVMREPAVTNLPPGSLAAMEAGRAEGLALLALDQKEDAKTVLERMKRELVRAAGDKERVRAPAIALREAIVGNGDSSDTFEGTFLGRTRAIDARLSEGDQRSAQKLATRDFLALANQADPDLPIFERFKRDLPGFVLRSRTPSPVLQSLRIEPPLAQPVEFHQPDGTTFTIDQPERPILLNFFVGIACPRCLIQLTQVAPHIPGLEADGIDFLSITPNLPATVAENDLPFRIVCDNDEDAFRGFGAHDHFGNRPLHATVLLSPSGRIVWQHVSEAPFAKPKALHREANRLLKNSESP